MCLETSFLPKKPIKMICKEKNVSNPSHSFSMNKLVRIFAVKEKTRNIIECMLVMNK